MGLLPRLDIPGAIASALVRVASFAPPHLPAVSQADLVEMLSQDFWRASPRPALLQLRRAFLPEGLKLQAWRAPALSKATLCCSGSKSALLNSLRASQQTAPDLLVPASIFCKSSLCRTASTIPSCIVGPVPIKRFPIVTTVSMGFLHCCLQDRASARRSSRTLRPLVPPRRHCLVSAALASVPLRRSSAA